MFLFTPARLRALTWVGAFVALVLMTEGTCTWGQYRDAYSVTPLPEHLVCELARTAALAGPDASCRLVERTESSIHAQVRSGDDEPIELCFLKAARWFVVDHGPRVTCTRSPPDEPGRISSWSQEWKVESRWQNTVAGQRQQREREAFLEHMRVMFERQKTLEPFACPTDLPVTRIPALDAALLRVKSAPWHFVTDDELEKVFDLRPFQSWDSRPAPPPLILLVVFDEKRLPVQQTPGFARGSISLVDWANDRVLCKALVSIEQPENAPRDLARPDVLMPDFKERVARGLGTQLTLMSGGSLELRPTW